MNYFTNIYFHATPSKNCASIEKEGIYGGDGYDPAHLSEYPKTGLVADLAEIAESEVALYLVNVDGLKLSESYEPDDDDCIAVDELITPDRIRRII